MAIPNLGAGNNGRETQIDIPEKIKDKQAEDFDKWTQHEEGNNAPTYSLNLSLKNYDQDIYNFSTKYIDLYDTDGDKKWDKEEYIQMATNGLGIEQYAQQTYQESTMGSYLDYWDTIENNIENTFNFFNTITKDDKIDASEFAAMLSVIDKQDGEQDGIITFDNYANLTEMANGAAPKITSEQVSEQETNTAGQVSQQSNANTNEVSQSTNEYSGVIFDDKEDTKTINHADGSRVEETTKYINGQIAVVNKKEYLANGTLQNEYNLIYDKSGTGEIVEKAGIWHNADGTNTPYNFVYKYNDKGEKATAKLYKYDEAGNQTHEFDITYAPDGSEAIRQETKIDPETGNIIIGRYDDIGRLLYEEELKSDNSTQKVRETYYKINSYEERGPIKSQTFYDDEGNVIEKDDKSTENEKYPESIKSDQAKNYYDMIKSGKVSNELIQEIKNNIQISNKELSILLDEAEKINPALFN